MTVKMTMQEYEELSQKAKWFEEIRRQVKNCVSQKWVDDQCTLVINPDKVKSLMFDYAAEDCELDGYTADAVEWEVQ